MLHWWDIEYQGTRYLFLENKNPSNKQIKLHWALERAVVKLALSVMVHVLSHNTAYDMHSCVMNISNKMSIIILKIYSVGLRSYKVGVIA